MKKLVIIVFLVMFIRANAQVAINTDGTAPDNSAMLDVKSTTKGVLLPRMTPEQISAISNPVNGLVVFNTANNKYYVYVTSTSTWKELLYGPGSITPDCGTFTIHHIAGLVAPVPKTVTYSTVANIPGAPSKCWITSNLGADHQANAKDDATEASAGWYWQFNRKQGYKNDGTTRTPNTAWIMPINENLNWQAANDPCTLELGSSWRLPTHFEWENVMAGGGWTNWNGPWNSALKLHAAGYLQYNDGTLSNQGVTALYWSGEQHSLTHAWAMTFNSSSNVINNLDKSFAYPVRCMKNY